MRLATFNLLNGRTPADQIIDPTRLAAAVRLLDPDVLALQEVDRRQPRSHLIDLTAVAAEAMGAVSHRFAPALLGTPGGEWRAAGGTEPGGGPEYGIALLARYPARTWRVLRPPGLRPGFALRWPEHHAVMVRDEPRVALVAELDGPSGPLAVAATHLSFLPGVGRRQLRWIARTLQTYADPAVILGDLNLVGALPSRITGYRSLARAATYPAGRPNRQLDHILLRGDLGPVLHGGALELPLSDHRALWVDL